MLSFLQQRLGKSPTKSQDKLTRQDSIESAFARVNARNVTKDSSATPSLTTAASLTDTSSEPTDTSDRPESHPRRLKRSRDSVEEDRADIRSGQQPNPLQTLDSDQDDRTKSDDYLLEGNTNNSQDHLLQKGVQALDADWSIGAMPGDDLHIPTNTEDHNRRRRSSRLDLLGHASSVMEMTTSVLGKRGHEAMEAGIEKIKALQSGRKKSSVRLSETRPTSVEHPRKRARFSATCGDNSSPLHSNSSANFVKKRSKHWVTQGLYVGQSPDFDARLTETKNKIKKASVTSKSTKKPSAIPLPMFAGERMLVHGRDFKLPFNVFSPLPPGQPKPDEWKKTHKNVFIGEAADLWKKAKPMEHSLCVCQKEDGCDERCFNRFMLYECDDNNCNIGAENCTNRAFADLKTRCKRGGKYNIGVEVMKTIDRGYGVRANRTFEPNQIITEYTGEIITQDECDYRMNTRYKDAKCYYLMDFDQSMVLDATRGSIARFINHSCAPNCRMIKWTVSGKPRMALFAGDEGIMTGEELTYNYNFDPFSAKNVQECRCGAEGCRGVLGPKPKEIKEALKPIVTSRKRKLQQVVEHAVEAVTKKRKIAVPSSVKSALATAKTQTSRRLSQASMLASSNAMKEPPAKKASTGSPKGLKRKSVMGSLKDEKIERPKKVESRRRSTGNTLPRGWKGWALVETPPESPTENAPPAEEGGSKWENIDAQPDSVKENEVRTVRRSNRGTPGKSIRVISLGKDEIKEWRSKNFSKLQ